MPAHNASVRAEQRKLREQMRGLGMSRGEIAAEMARRYQLRPRAAWRIAWGWTLDEAAERYNALRAKGAPQAVTSLTGSRLSEWEKWPFSTRKPSILSLSLLAEIYHAGVLDLIDFHDREKLASAELLTLDKAGATPLPQQPPPSERFTHQLDIAAAPAAGRNSTSGPVPNVPDLGPLTAVLLSFPSRENSDLSIDLAGKALNLWRLRQAARYAELAGDLPQLLAKALASEFPHAEDRGLTGVRL